MLLDIIEPDVILRGIKEMNMQEEGRIANIVELDILWDDQKVCRVIKGRFDGLVDETHTAIPKV